MFEIVQSETFNRWRMALKDRQAVARVNARIRRLSEGNPGDAKPVRKVSASCGLTMARAIGFISRGAARW